jgi:hypothetical protein
MVPEAVEKSGLAVVTAGDRIFPASGSTAVMAPLAPSTVNYYFPVEIEVIGGGLAALADQIYRELREKLEDLG